ncbi:MAG: O-antigen ligase family protein [Myxococcales bacterium]|nr:O-antigen ligase family protein [Myxococcales bacterium]
MRARDRVALGAVAATLALAGVLVGGATRWAACVAAAAAVGAAAVHLTSRRTASRPGPLVLLIAIAAVATVAQLAPLPEAIATIVAPEKWALVQDRTAALGQAGPRWVMASHDPPATLVELAKLVGYLALAWSATRLASQRRARPWLAAAAVGAAALVAVIALAHRLAGATTLYGVFRMPNAEIVPAPLINENHLAGLTAMMVPLAIGLGLAWHGGKRMLAFTAALVLAGTALLTASRGGAVGLGAGAVVAAIVLVAQRRAGIVDDNRRAPASITVPAMVVAACALVLFGLISARGVARELDHSQLSELSEPSSKYQMWTTAAPMIVEHRWLGIGHGAFEPVYAQRNPVDYLTYGYVENAYLQAAIDWGVPATLALLLALGALTRAAVRRWRHGPIEAGALGALASIAIHDVVDFSLEMPAVAMAAIVVAALLVPARLGTDEQRAPLARPVLLRRAGLLVAALLAVVVAATPLGRGARVERAALPDRASSAAALAVLERHPADGLAAGRVAAALYAERDARALPMIRHALALRPNHGALHLLAARMLTSTQRPQQAAGQYAQAIVLTRDIGPIIDEILARLPGVDADGFPDAARALPDDPRHVGRVCSALAARKRHDVALAYTEAIAARDPERVDVQFNRGAAALELGRWAIALAAAQALTGRMPGPRPALMQAFALDGMGRQADGVAILAALPPPDTAAERGEVALYLAHLQSKLGRHPAARETLVAVVDQLDGSPRLEAELRKLLAVVEDALGHTQAAAWERKRADELIRSP